MWLFAQEEHHDNYYFLPGDINEFYWGSLAFLVLVAAFVWKGLPLIRRAMASRSERIADELAAAEAAEVEAREELERVRAGLGNAEEEAARIRAEAEERAAQVAADFRSRAEADVAQSRRRAEIEIEALRFQAMADLRAEVAARATAAAEAVVRDSLDDQTQARLIDRYIEQVGGR